MRVLYLLNISNPDRLSADSGWIFADLLAPALADAGAEVTVAAPAAAGDTRCGFHRTKVPGTKYRARFSADIDELVTLIRAEKPDVVVANQIEEAPAVRMPCWRPDRAPFWPGTATTCRSRSPAAGSCCSTRPWTTRGSDGRCCWRSPPGWPRATG